MVFVREITGLTVAPVIASGLVEVSVTCQHNILGPITAHQTMTKGPDVRYHGTTLGESQAVEQTLTVIPHVCDGCTSKLILASNENPESPRILSTDAANIMGAEVCMGLFGCLSIEKDLMIPPYQIALAEEIISVIGAE